MVLRIVNGEAHLQRVYQARVSHNKQLHVALCPGPMRLWAFATKKLVNADLGSGVCTSAQGLSNKLDRSRQLAAKQFTTPILADLQPVL